MIWRRQLMAASRQRASKSAPTKPWVISARCSMRTSPANGIPRLWISRISRRPRPSGGDGVDFVKEQDARSFLGCLFEDFPEVGLAFTVKLVDNLRPADGKEIGLCLGGDGEGDEGLPTAGRAVEEHALGRVDPEAFKDLGITQGQLDHFTYALELGFQAAES